jgi:uncharacterized protein (TIGR00730 family)
MGVSVMQRLWSGASCKARAEGSGEYAEPVGAVIQRVFTVSISSHEAKMGSICVFCGSGLGADPSHEALAQQAGRAIAARGWRMVYGGGAAGLMGVAARACLEAGGSVLGVIPEFLIPVEGAQEGADIRITATMGARKAMMVEEADAFLILPGGAGTLEEVFDMIMLCQLGRHAKPSAFADEAYWAPLQALMRHVVQAGYAKPDVLEAMSFHAQPDAALDALAGAVEAAQ